ncbi:PA2169 family four-helix-bundle protein [Chryseobacterium sp. PBS4-4]|uniref:PA2169 family four-helix-bundle protein n=1 Tax=Chryseobacterium edaphi TaxID=2976532 RepID=A0ABT2WAQ3_9FLAO|nr:PA2169 family four-helix-bundle protein [Chryseobacterium edaphi]MCU7619302.1 PA2169 family four-helix-bundle protein [Chryseobacterium edaphi]
MNNERIAVILNDLLHITNDRIAGFENVEGKVWESYSDLKGEYDHMISDSKLMKVELINLIQEKGGKADDSASTAGAIHRAWIDLKNSLPIGNKEKSTLENVVYGEQNAINAYQEVLTSGDLDPESTKVVSEHLRQIRESHTKFKNIEEYKKKS